MTRPENAICRHAWDFAVRCGYHVIVYRVGAYLRYHTVGPAYTIPCNTDVMLIRSDGSIKFYDKWYKPKEKR